MSKPVASSKAPADDPTMIDGVSHTMGYEAAISNLEHFAGHLVGWFSGWIEC